jgi:hypothetical protein
MIIAKMINEEKTQSIRQTEYRIVRVPAFLQGVEISFPKMLADHILHEFQFVAVLSTKRKVRSGLYQNSDLARTVCSGNVWTLHVEAITTVIGMLSLCVRHAA